MNEGFPALSDAFPAALAAFGRTIGPPLAGAVPLPELLAAGRLTLVAQRSAATSGREGRAALSMWSQHYLLALVPCACAALLSATRTLPVAMGGMAVMLGEAGEPCRLCVPHAGGTAIERCPMRRLAPLLRDNLGPVARAMTASGLPPPVFWSNAASYLVWSLRVIDASAEDRAAVLAALTRERWADGGANPFHPVLGPRLARRFCCLRFQLADCDRCPDCPKGVRPCPTSER